MIRVFSLIAFLFTALQIQAAERPNIVFILSEDNSHHYLDLFFESGASTPHIEALAKNGLIFENAFSNSPVCSVARTTLATSCYGPRIGTQFHRRFKDAAMPEGLKMFPAYLRDSGYYTTNNSKKDYAAVEGPGVWDESSNNATWRKRKDKSSPFFHMETFKETHESSLHFQEKSYQNDKTKNDPAGITLADYFPDTPLFRYTHARYHDNIQTIDEKVGNTVKKLEEDGVLEDTFIFYFGDHGGVLPRGKGYIYESGLHIPLVIRIPENFKHLVDADLGSRQDGFVSFVDFGPTALNLAGVPVPKQVDGKPFLGKNIRMDEVNARDTAFGYADRFDEKYEFLRSLHKGKFQYIRAYQNWLPDGLQNNYRYRMLAYHEWRELFKAGKLTDEQAAFFQPKPVEMLFDTEADPHEVNNLASDPAHAETLKEMRAALHEHVTAMPDLSFYPESELIANAMSSPIAYGQKHASDIEKLADIADLALIDFEKAKPGIQAALQSENQFERMWGAMVCSAFGDKAESVSEALAGLATNDSSEIVQVRAAEFLGITGKTDPLPILVEIINTTADPVLAVEALNSVVLFQDHFDAYQIDSSLLKPAARNDGVSRRLDYLNGHPYKSKPLSGKKPKKKK